MRVHAVTDPALSLASLRPLLDRIDIQVEVSAIRYQDLASRDAGEASEIIRQRVNKARTVQLQRFQKRNIHSNAQMGQRYQTLLRRERRRGEAAGNRHQQIRLERPRLQPGPQSRPHHRRSRRCRRNPARSHRRGDSISKLGPAIVDPM